MPAISGVYRKSALRLANRQKQVARKIKWVSKKRYQRCTYIRKRNPKARQAPIGWDARVVPNETCYQGRSRLHGKTWACHLFRRPLLGVFSEETNGKDPNFHGSHSKITPHGSCLALSRAPRVSTQTQPRHSRNAPCFELAPVSRLFEKEAEGKSRILGAASWAFVGQRRSSEAHWRLEAMHSVYFSGSKCCPAAKPADLVKRLVTNSCKKAVPLGSNGWQRRLVRIGSPRSPELK